MDCVKPPNPNNLLIWCSISERCVWIAGGNVEDWADLIYFKVEAIQIKAKIWVGCFFGSLKMISGSFNLLLVSTLDQAHFQLKVGCLNEKDDLVSGEHL